MLSKQSADCRSRGPKVACLSSISKRCVYVMKQLSRVSLLAAGFITVLGWAPAYASTVLFSSGPASPYPHNIGGFLIDNTNTAEVTDRFALASSSTVVGFSIPIWITVGGGTLQSFDWAITSLEFGGTVEGSGTATSFTSVDVSSSTTGFNGAYNVTIETISTTLSLDSGYHWLQLSNATSTGGGDVLWDAANINSGYGQQNYGGTLHNNNFTQTFQILGPGGVTPVPAALPLFATGLGLLGLLGWPRKRKAQAAG